jgi:hypothetical protein
LDKLDIFSAKVSVFVAVTAKSEARALIYDEASLADPPAS